MMPRYNTHPEDYRIDEAIARKVWQQSKGDIDRALVGVLWRFQPREGELVRVQREWMSWGNDYIQIRFPTLKLRKGGAFKTKERLLGYARGTGEAYDIFLESIIAWAQQVPPGMLLFPHKEGWVYKRIAKLTLDALGTQLTPYHFRHWGFNYLNEFYGVSENQLAYWKGGTVSSVRAYMHAVPMSIGIRDGKRILVHGFIPGAPKPEESNVQP